MFWKKKKWAFVLWAFVNFIPFWGRGQTPILHDSIPHDSGAYRFPVLPGWGTEHFPIPIGFAPAIPFTGVEEIRFSPGWAKPESPEYWTYAFLWYVEGNVRPGKTQLAQYLKAYYTGLFQVNTQGRERKSARVRPCTVRFSKTSGTGEAPFFSGVVEMMDYMRLQPLDLYFQVVGQPCPRGSKSALIFMLSPQKPGHPNWLKLEKIRAGFSCL